jgi:hypothetical protein
LDDDVAVTRFVARLRDAQDDERDVVIDFQRAIFAKQLPALVLVIVIRELFAKRTSAGRNTFLRGADARTDGTSYLAQMGFFRLLGVDERSVPVRTRGGPNYRPIRVVRWQELEESPNGLYRGLEQHAAGVARVLFPKADAALYGVQYSLVEAIRNVFEHTAERECLTFAQSLPNRQRLTRIAVADAGCGVQAALSGEYPGLSAIDAVKKAIQPGVTSGRHRTTDPSDPYRNTGFGLYVLSELARRCEGEFVLWSSDVWLVVTAGGMRTRSAVFSGTAVNLELTPSPDMDFKKVIKEIVRDGGGADASAVTSRSKGKTIDVSMLAVDRAVPREFLGLDPAHELSATNGPTRENRRPRRGDLIVRRAVAEQLADDIVYHSGMTRERIVADLVVAMDKADLERPVEVLCVDMGWEVNEQIATLLDGVEVAWSRALADAIEYWVSRYGVSACYGVGEAVPQIGTIISVNEKLSEYRIRLSSGGVVDVKFEDMPLRK